MCTLSANMLLRCQVSSFTALLGENYIPMVIEFFPKGSKGESVKSGGGKTSALLCSE